VIGNYELGVTSDEVIYKSEWFGLMGGYPLTPLARTAAQVGLIPAWPRWGEG